MRVETRRRVHDDHVSSHLDVVLIAESEKESLALDALGDSAIADVPVVGEVRLSDDVATHYVLLRGKQDSLGERAESEPREEGPRSPTPADGAPDEQEPGMGARTPAPKYHLTQRAVCVRVVEVEASGPGAATAAVLLGEGETVGGWLPIEAVDFLGEPAEVLADLEHDG